MRQIHLWLLLLAALIAGQLSLAAGTALPPALTISPPSGRYAHAVQVRLTAPAGYTIRYRLNQQPVAHRYQGAISLPASEPSVTTIAAQLYAADGTAVGAPLLAHYALGWENGRLPVLSLAIEPDDFVGEAGIYSRFEQKGDEWERPISLAYLSPAAPFVSAAGLRIHGNWTRTFFAKKSFRLYFRETYNSEEWDLFAEEGDRFVLHNSGQDLLVMKNSLITELATELDLPAPAIQPVLLFLNGEPWGIYHVRERIDLPFLQRRYGNHPFDLLDTPDNPNQQRVESGSRVHWDNLLAYVASHDMHQPATLAYVETQVNLDNFVDYALLQLYAADRDWPEFNVNQFRASSVNGRWHWIFWDNDLSFDESERPLFPPVLEPAEPATALLLRSLLQNEAFRQRFVGRGEELLATLLAPEAMTARVEQLTAVYDADIPLEQARWNIDRSWETRRGELLTFVQQRPAVMQRELTAVLSIDFPTE